MDVGDSDFAAAVWEHAGSGLYAVDALGMTVLMNAAARRILGCATPDAPVGAPCEEVLGAHPALCRLVRGALAGRPPLSRAEIALERPDGAHLTLGFSLAAVPGDGGSLRGAALVFRDLTPIERSGERDRLRDRLAALGEMAAGLAHELRNPLAGMEVVAGLLQRRLAGDPESQDLLRDLRGQLRQLAETVTSSLDFLRPVSLRRERIDPAALLEEALGTALQRASRPVRVERCYASPPAELEADRSLLGTALANLVVNAVEAMEQGSTREPELRLAIAVAPAPDLTRTLRVDREEVLPGDASQELCIAIADNGPGIPEACRDRIFDPFFTTKDTGSGIGLANVQKIVTAHGGCLSISSGPGGSEFRVHLPLGPGAP